MKFEDALAFIEKHHPHGFRVEFEKRDGGILASDHFPANDEPALGTEEVAWKLAERFAEAGKDRGIVNVYVIRSDDFTPVIGYAEKKLNVY